MKKLLFILIAVSLFSCKPVERIVEREKEIIKIEYRNQLLRDSIYFADTVLIDHKGDTVRITEIKHRYKDRFVRDTIRLTDSLYVEKPVYINVPAELSGWQKFKLKYFKWLALSAFLLLLYALRKPISKFIRNVFLKFN